MTAINLYLNFKGTTEQAFNFYKSVFGGEFTILQRFREMPDSSNFTDEQKDQIMHVSYPIGKHFILMSTDVLETTMGGQPLAEGNNFSVSVTPDTKEDADKFFNQLSEGGKITIPISDTFWGAYFGTVEDKFGINWMINYEYNK